MELHAVHLNNKYTDKEALKGDGGILVFTRLFNIKEDKEDSNDLGRSLKKVQQIGSRTQVKKSSLIDLGLDCGQNFVVYKGSSTFPPCTENAIWLICANVGTISPYVVKNKFH